MQVNISVSYLRKSIGKVITRGQVEDIISESVPMRTQLCEAVCARLFPDDKKEKEVHPVGTPSTQYSDLTSPRTPEKRTFTELMERVLEQLCDVRDEISVLAKEVRSIKGDGGDGMEFKRRATACGGVLSLLSPEPPHHCCYCSTVIPEGEGVRTRKNAFACEKIREVLIENSDRFYTKAGGVKSTYVKTYQVNKDMHYICAKYPRMFGWSMCDVLASPEMSEYLQYDDV